MSPKKLYTEEDLISEAIKFFTKLIRKRREKLGIDTRPVNFAGNIGRQMKREVKDWFLNKYPNNCDYVKFFLQNDTVFHYDRITGDVYMNTGAQQLFQRPERFGQLEEMCVEDINLYQMSQYMFELEFFIAVFKIFEESYSLKKTYQLKSSLLSQLFSDPKFGKMFEMLDHILTKPEFNNSEEFEKDLMSYLSLHYSEIFEVDKESQTIKMHQKIIESLKKVIETIDDTTYKLFECLLAKYIETNGPKDVDLLYSAVKSRHPFIVSHIFRQSLTTDDYTLIDFCHQFGQTFEILLVDKNDGRIERLIKLRQKKALPVIQENDPSEDEEVYESEDEETYMSEDDEVYNSSDECTQTVKV